MNKRQKKKLYKKLHGHNPPKVLEKPVQLIKPELKPLNLPAMVAGMRQFRRDLDKMLDGIRQTARNITSAIANCINNPVTEEVPPYITTAKILTAQRAAGKRRKRNYSKRRI